MAPAKSDGFMESSSYTLESSHELGFVDAGIETKEGQTTEFVFILKIINNKSFFVLLCLNRVNCKNSTSLWQVRVPRAMDLKF